MNDIIWVLIIFMACPIFTTQFPITFPNYGYSNEEIEINERNGKEWNIYFSNDGNQEADNENDTEEENENWKAFLNYFNQFKKNIEVVSTRQPTPVSESEEGLWDISEYLALLRGQKVSSTANI